MKFFFILFATLLLNLYLSVECSKLVAFTFGNGHGDSVRRQLESAKTNNIELKVIEQEGNVVDVRRLSAIRDYVETMKDDKDTIVLFTESGSLFLNSSDGIKERFESMSARLVLSADDRCRPDITLKDSYPNVTETEKRFVDANGLIGYADTIFNALSEESLKPILDSQYYFSKLFISPDLRTKFNVKLDSRSMIFQNMAGSFAEVNIEHSPSGEGYLTNVLTDSIPAIVQPNGKKQHFNNIANYLGKSWDPIRGCQQCSQDRIDLDAIVVSEYPKTTIAIFIDYPTPFLNEFFSRISKLTYRKSKVNIRVSNIVPTHEATVKSFLDRFGSLYNSISYLDSSNNKTSVDRRLDAIRSCSAPNCDFLFFIDSISQLTNEDTVQILISYNKSIVAPIMSRREQLWSNFWGAISLEGYYSRSFDYLDIVNGVKKGIWNVPHIHSIYLMKSEILPNIHDVYSPVSEYQESEIDMIFSGNLRKKDQFMFVVNEDMFGYLVDAENTTTEHMHNDLWEIFANPLDWKEKYIHENYSSAAAESTTLDQIAQPCPDVFWWPFVTETFAKHMIEEMEFFGKWSDGNNSDSRLEGGYENVPTRDIHMRQVKWEEHWMHALKTYVYPMQMKVFKGYFDEPLARMNFVVRYKPTEQDRLKPHHDASSYTLNLALNKPGHDYEGGGAKFNRYACAIIHSKVGWVLMHPGRVTHLHEGLPTTKGTRYIFVTFVNP